MPRARLIQILYDSLPKPAKDNYFLNKNVESIVSDATKGVVVECSDGTFYTGDIVIGADGVHSKTRQFMRKLAISENPDVSWDPEHPYTSAYRCLWCSFPRASAPGHTSDTQDTGRSIVYLSGKEQSWIFLYEKLRQSTQEKTKYTEEDIGKYAATFAKYHITEAFTVEDVFPRRLKTGISNIEEGLVHHWSYGRIVLAGDACHKFTPNAGLGLNTGIQDAVSLTNTLRHAIAESSDRKPDADILQGAFAEYQAERMPMVTSDASLSASLTRLQTWDGWINYLVARFVVPLRLIKYLVFEVLMSRSTKQGLVLDHIPAKEPFQGNIGWVHSMPAQQLDDGSSPDL